MTLTTEEQRFLSAQRLGRLATVGPDGTPQVKPVGFHYNQELGTIDISGYNMARSAKYKNVQRNPRVAFVVDDTPGEGPEGVRFLEIRGTGETLPGQGQSDPIPGASPPSHALAPEIIRIRPRRVLSYNVDPERPGLQARGIGADRLRPEVA
jgi:pyridoxamine 5'-phosphate oxidase family protein